MMNYLVRYPFLQFLIFVSSYFYRFHEILFPFFSFSFHRNCKRPEDNKNDFSFEEHIGIDFMEWKTEENWLVYHNFMCKDKV